MKGATAPEAAGVVHTDFPEGLHQGGGRGVGGELVGAGCVIGLVDVRVTEGGLAGPGPGGWGRRESRIDLVSG